MKELDEIKVESNQQTIAWENRKKLGQIIGWLITWKNIIFSPSHFFKKLNPDGKITDAFLFAILTHLFCLAIVFIRPLQNTSNRSVLTFIGLYTFRFIILAIALLFIRSVVFNLASKFAGGKYGYRTTFRICGYVEAISLLIIAVSFIPIAKLRYVVKTALIIYGIVLYFIAFKKVQHIKSFKAFFALLSAMILVAILNIVLETSIVAYGIHRGFSSVINKNNKITEEVNEKKQAPKSDKNLFSTKADEQFGRFAKKDEIVGFWKLIPLPDEISEKINIIKPYP